MSKFISTALAIAIVSSITLVTIAASESPSTPAPARAAAAHRVAAVHVASPPAARPAAVKVIMRDPGCHWFQVGSKFKTKLAVSGGAAKLTNYDEAALKIKASGVHNRVNVGRAIALTPGRYTITMVGQPSDDNTLHLTVH
jgi:hypothetical protein